MKKTLAMLCAAVTFSFAAMAADNIAATGKIVNVDAEKNIVKLTHDPIPSLGWPTMTMLFTVDKAVNISAYSEGDAVNFTLTPKGEDDYFISSISKQ